MRLITTSSRYPYYLAASCLSWLLPTVVFGYSLAGDGCFEREAGIVRLTAPSCTLTLTPDSDSEAVEFSFENVDPETVTMTADPLVATQTASTLAVSGTIIGDTIVTITPWYEIEDELWYIAISDNQAHGTVESNPVFEDMLPTISAINPPFMTNAGDLVNGSDDDDTIRDMFASVLATLEDTTVPMYPTPGNHDYDSGLTAYADYFGEPDYYYDLGPARLIALSTSGATSRGTVTTEQLNWLADAMDSTSLQTIVYFHHPLSVPSWGRSTCCFEDNNERDVLGSTLEEHGADYVVNGHSQGYDYRFLTTADVSTLIAGLSQLISGGAGGNIAQPDGDYHFTMVHVTPTEITHQVFESADTSLAFDATNSSGGHNTATITSEYSGAEDLPYLRLKFRLQNHADATYLVQDESGNYLPFQSHVYDDEIVLLAATEQVKNTTVNYTATVATTLLTAMDATANADGNLLFSTDPTTDNIDSGITVVPDTDVTVITAFAATNTGYSWIESPAVETVNTTYTITGLADNQLVNVYVDDALIERLVTRTTGEASFTVRKDATSRAITVAILPDTAIREIVTLPLTDGTSHLRRFTANGTYAGGWFAFDQDRADFDVAYAWLTDSTEPDYLVHRSDTQRLGLFSADGSLLDTVPADGSVSTYQQQLVVLDGQRLKTYRWSETKQQLVLQSSKRFTRHRLSDFLLLDDALVVVTKRPQHLVLQYYTETNSHWVLDKIKPLRRQGTAAQLAAVGEDIVVAGDKLQIYSRNLDRLYSTGIPGKSVQQVVVGQLSDHIVDTIAVLADGTVYPYRHNDHRLKKLPALDVNAQALGMVQFADRTYRSLVMTTATTPAAVLMYHYRPSSARFTERYVFSPYGESFPGTVTIAEQSK